ncbi:efflux RND transporter periplasmic adaptor subunit [Nannocystis punicea]|uniref:Efflux RND transporter periplasmic adaptor subunit n=1 Tax=Nannocystis punicea TaxID=2995304 RepID=A0ABY7H0D5_9BACT|nr:efflux RND transporter periplasmic adaptor subunit [Nannocystis poenicansa]WAS92585.1 efflux RND transporter periplasmic adaptor subunit [Nannocystis poenicansa]
MTDLHHDDPETMREGAEAPPPGVALMAGVRWLLLLGTLAAACFAWWSYANAEPVAAQHAPRYRCPMHPQITSHEPGECPICHMALEPIPEDEAETVYRCPMHPQIQQAEPGECPICGMDLEPVAAEAVAVSADMPAGTAAITLGLDRLQAIGARVVVAEEREFTAELRSAALTEFSEDGAARVHVRAAGFIERIAVAETGVRVRKGQVLAEYYSPEIYQAQAELLAAHSWSGPVVGAARQRLELLGLSSAAVDRILKSGKPDRTTPVVAPAAGVVVARTAVLGAYVRPEEPLYELREDHGLYLVAELPAARAVSVKPGTKGHVRFTSRPELDRELAVDLVYPSVAADSRSVRVRMPLDNDDRALVAGMPAVVTFALPSETGVAVPRDAIVDAGNQPYVFVDAGGGRLVPRPVVLGVRDPEFVRVREGLTAGERVVAGATFLVDAESRLRAALIPSSTPGAATPSHAQHPTDPQPSAEATQPSATTASAAPAQHSPDKHAQHSPAEHAQHSDKHAQHSPDKHAQHSPAEHTQHSDSAPQPAAHSKHSSAEHSKHSPAAHSQHSSDAASQHAGHAHAP